MARQGIGCGFTIASLGDDESRFRSTGRYVVKAGVLDWLRVEFGVEKPGQKLEDFAALDADAFLEKVRKRRPRSEGRLSPAAL